MSCQSLCLCASLPVYEISLYETGLFFITNTCILWFCSSAKRKTPTGKQSTTPKYLLWGGTRQLLSISMSGAARTYAPPWRSVKPTPAGASLIWPGSAPCQNALFHRRGSFPTGQRRATVSLLQTPGSILSLSTLWIPQVRPEPTTSLCAAKLTHCPKHLKSLRSPRVHPRAKETLGEWENTVLFFIFTLTNDACTLSVFIINLQVKWEQWSCWYHHEGGCGVSFQWGWDL